MASGHVERRSKHGWTLVIDHGRYVDPVTHTEGQRREYRAIRNCTKAEALAQLYDVLSEINKGTYVKPSTVTLADYLHQWYDQHCVPRLAPKTLECYRQAIAHLTPILGTIALANLTPPLVQAAYSQLLAQGVGKRSVQLAHVVLRMALKQAVRAGSLYRNATDAVTPPGSPKHEMVALRPDEVDTLLHAAQESGILEFVILALSTGLRRGELLALQWQDIDWPNATLKVDKTLQRVEKRILVKPPKTQRSRRTVPLDEETLILLRHMRGRTTSTFVFSRPDGQPLDPSTVTHQFKRLARKAGFPAMRLHDTRHTYATLAFLAHVELRLVQDLLGHEDISTTANTYTHVTSEAKEAAAEAIGRMLRSGKRHVSDESDAGR
jgi:integrase